MLSKRDRPVRSTTSRAHEMLPVEAEEHLARTGLIEALAPHRVITQSNNEVFVASAHLAKDIAPVRDWTQALKSLRAQVVYDDRDMAARQQWLLGQTRQQEPVGLFQQNPRMVPIVYMDWVMMQRIGKRRLDGITTPYLVPTVDSSGWKSRFGVDSSRMIACGGSRIASEPLVAAAVMERAVNRTWYSNLGAAAAAWKLCASTNKSATAFSLDGLSPLQCGGFSGISQDARLQDSLSRIGASPRTVPVTTFWGRAGRSLKTKRVGHRLEWDFDGLDSIEKSNSIRVKTEASELLALHALQELRQNLPCDRWGKNSLQATSSLQWQSESIETIKPSPVQMLANAWFGTAESNGGGQSEEARSGLKHASDTLHNSLVSEALDQMSQVALRNPRFSSRLVESLQTMQLAASPLFSRGPSSDSAAQILASGLVKHLSVPALVRPSLLSLSQAPAFAIRWLNPTRVMLAASLGHSIGRLAARGIVPQVPGSLVSDVAALLASGISAFSPPTRQWGAVESFGSAVSSSLARWDELHSESAQLARMLEVHPVSDRAESSSCDKDDRMPSGVSGALPIGTKSGVSSPTGMARSTAKTSVVRVIFSSSRDSVIGMYLQPSDAQNEDDPASESSRIRDILMHACDKSQLSSTVSGMSMLLMQAHLHAHASSVDPSKYMSCLSLQDASEVHNYVRSRSCEIAIGLLRQAEVPISLPTPSDTSSAG